MTRKGHSARLAARKAEGALLRVLIMLAASMSLCSALGAGAAYADVRKADVIVDQTVESRGLPIAECPSIDAEHAALVDSEGTVYFSRAGDEHAQIASITKVMTAIVALEKAASDTTVIVSAEAAEVGESSANLQEGDAMDVDAALKALLVPSGNDAAIALAETVGAQIVASGSAHDDPLEAFVDAMNEKASQLGCNDTLYENPHGLDDEEYAGDLHSTALDQAKVARCAMGFPEIREIVGGGSTTITVKRAGKTETIELETTDGLLESYDAAIGIKTGMTDLAGPSFMGAANKDGRELYAVVLGSSDEYQRFEDAEALFEWYYDHVREVALANSDEWTTMRRNGESRDVPVVAAASHGDWIDRTVKATFADPDVKLEVFDLEGNVSQSMQFEELRGTVNPGDKVGKVTFKQRNMVVAEQDLVACETVEGPNPIDAIAIMWQRFVGGFGGEAAQADSEVYNVMPIIDNNKTSAA